jgi:hypothetical protein
VILDRGIDDSDFDFLAKPFSSLLLVEKVESLLDHAEGRSGSG